MAKIIENTKNLRQRLETKKKNPINKTSLDIRDEAMPQFIPHDLPIEH